MYVSLLSMKFLKFKSTKLQKDSIIREIREIRVSQNVRKFGIHEILENLSPQKLRHLR